MKTTICALGSKRISVDGSPLTDTHVRLVIESGYGVYEVACIDNHGAAVLGQALLELAKKIEDEKQFPAALTSGIDWQQVNAIARGNA